MLPAWVLLLLLWAGPCTAFRIPGRALRQQQQTTDVLQDNGLLLHSMHCFSSNQNVFVQNADFQPSSNFLATGNRVEFVAVPEAAEAALASSTCETAGPIDLTFAVPPSCDLQLKLYFSSGNSAEQHMMRVHVNGVAVGKDYDFGSAGAGGDIVQVPAQSDHTGILEVSLLPLEAKGKVALAGIQVFSTDKCSAPIFTAADTTGETDSAGEESQLVYRMACSSIAGIEPMDISIAISDASSTFLQEQEAFVGRVEDADATADLFQHLCMPAMDADHLEMTIPVDQDVTYEVRLFFTQETSTAWSNVMVTSGGVDVFPETQEFFRPGPGQKPAYHIKRFEARAGPEGLQLSVSALNGFPPISGVEVWKVLKKAAAAGITLLDSPDDNIVVACGSKSFLQSPSGIVIYPGPEAFTSAGLTLAPVQSVVKAVGDGLKDLVEGGLFSAVCTAAAGQPITASFAVQTGEQYTVEVLLAETWKNAAAGSRVLAVQVDGESVASGIDVVKDEGLNVAVGLIASVAASGSRMTVTVTASVGQPMVSGVSVSGVGVDAAAADRPHLQAGTGLSVATACGSVGPAWSAFESIAAAGFQKYTTSEKIEGAVGESLQALYSTQCYAAGGGTLTLKVAVVPKAQLRLVFHFAELLFIEPGKRSFDVKIDGITQLEAVDIVKEEGAFKALVKEVTLVATKSTLVVEVVSVENNAVLNGLEIYSLLSPNITLVDTSTADDGTTPEYAPAPFIPPSSETPCVPVGSIVQLEGLLDIAPPAMGFGAVDPSNWQTNFASLQFTNDGNETRTVTHISCTPSQASNDTVASFFIVQFGAGPWAPRAQCTSHGTVPLNGTFPVPPSSARVAVVLFQPWELLEAAVMMHFWQNETELAQVTMTGTGGNPWAKAHTLHPVTDSASVFSEADQYGGAVIQIDGSTSHTHAPGRKLQSFVWEDVPSKQVVGKGEVVRCFYPFGTHTLSLTITDDAMESLSSTVTVVVAPESSVPGTLVQLYPSTSSLNPLPGLPQEAEMTPFSFTLPHARQPTSGSFLLRMVADVYCEGGPTSITISGAPTGTQPWIGLDGKMLNTGEFNATTGDHLLDVRLLMPSSSAINVFLNDQPITSSHSNISAHPPIINQLATDSRAKPGNIGLLKGFQLSPPASLFVGDTSATITEHSRDSIAFTYPKLPPGKHSITVKRKGATSNVVTVTMLPADDKSSQAQGGPFSPTPKFTQKYIEIAQPSRVLFCHGKIYAANAYATSEIAGGIHEIIVNSNYDVISRRMVIPTPQPVDLGIGNVTEWGAFAAWAILGLACDPRDAEDSFKLYFTLSPLYAQGGKQPTMPAPYYGKVMYVQPNAAEPTAVPLIENLSVSNTDHEVNGLDFLHDGRLIFAVGSQTNAGMPGPIGYLPENPTSASVLAADINSPAFDGTLTYSFLPGAPAEAFDPNDQRYGDWVQSTSTSVVPFATGTRNAYGIKVGLRGNVMLTVNGPNLLFGAELTGLDADGFPMTAPDPETADALYVDLREGCHGGFPNLAHCRAGLLHHCKYESMETIMDTPLTCAPDAILPSSIGGITEYNSYAFGGAMRGKLFVAGYKKHVFRFDPTEKKIVTDKDDQFYPGSPGIDIVHAPAGVHLIASLEASKILINVPVDAQLIASGNPSVYDISPDRGMATQPGANTFVIGGANFDTIEGNIAVAFGGVQATNVTVAGPEWITGTIPSNPSGACSTKITVSFASTTLSLPEAFCYLAQ